MRPMRKCYRSEKATSELLSQQCCPATHLMQRARVDVLSAFGSIGIGLLCILIVEDEPLILDIIAETLEDAGYDVVTAATGPQAVALIAAGAIRFSALFSDFHLPGGLTGLDVAAAMRKRFPQLPVILATGRPDVLERSWQPSTDYILLQKPYLPSDMLRTLSRLVPPHHH